MHFHSTQLYIAHTQKEQHEQYAYILDEALKISKQLGIYSPTIYEGHHSMAPFLFCQAAAELVIDATVWFSALYCLDDFFGEDTLQGESADAEVLFQAWIVILRKPILLFEKSLERGVIYLFIYRA